MTTSPLVKKDELVVPPFKCSPEVVITLSFQPVITSKSKLEQKVKDTLEKAEQYILQNYTIQQALPLFARLQYAMNNLNFYTHKKGLAVFASPAFDKTLYLDFEVEDHLHIDKDFKLLDLAKFKKDEKHYLLLFLQAETSTVYLGNETDLKLIKENKRDSSNSAASTTHLPYPHAYLPVTFMDNYLLQIDNGLGLLSTAYPYPVFVAGEEKLVDRFLAYTLNKHVIAATAAVKYNRLNKDKLTAFVLQYLDNWEEMNQKIQLHKLDRARVEGKLAWGTRAIWNSGIRAGAVLVAEKGYTYPARKFEKQDRLYNLPVAFNQEFYLADAADEVAEKVLEAGGNICLLENGSLIKYAHLAMISP